MRAANAGRLVAVALLAICERAAGARLRVGSSPQRQARVPDRLHVLGHVHLQPAGSSLDRAARSRTPLTLDQRRIGAHALVATQHLTALPRILQRPSLRDGDDPQDRDRHGAVCPSHARQSEGAALQYELRHHHRCVSAVRLAGDLLLVCHPVPDDAARREDTALGISLGSLRASPIPERLGAWLHARTPSFDTSERARCRCSPRRASRRPSPPPSSCSGSGLAGVAGIVRRRSRRDALT